MSPRARSLFEAGRRSLQPNAADRERVLAALSGRIGGFEAKGDGTGPVPASASGLSWPTITVFVFGLAIAGAGVFALLRPAAQQSVALSAASAPVTSARPEPVATAPAPEGSTPDAEGASPGAAELPRAGSHPSAAAPVSDRLAEEVAILSEAERDLHAEQYQSALRLLDEHRRKFPNGTLVQERMAARVQALCGLGRVSDAQVALARLERRSPNSPHEAGAKEACGFKH